MYHLLNFLIHLTPFNSFTTSTPLMKRCAKMVTLAYVTSHQSNPLLAPNVPWIEAWVFQNVWVAHLLALHMCTQPLLNMDYTLLATTSWITFAKSLAFMVALSFGSTSTMPWINMTILLLTICHIHCSKNQITLPLLQCCIVTNLWAMPTSNFNSNYSHSSTTIVTSQKGESKKGLEFLLKIIC